MPQEPLVSGKKSPLILLFRHLAIVGHTQHTKCLHQGSFLYERPLPHPLLEQSFVEYMKDRHWPTRRIWRMSFTGNVIHCEDFHLRTACQVWARAARRSRPGVDTATSTATNKNPNTLHDCGWCWPRNQAVTRAQATQTPDHTSRRHLELQLLEEAGPKPVLPREPPLPSRPPAKSPPLSRLMSSSKV